ncbi:MAG: hypothetical protein ABII01_07325 [Candidatus Woesearchaeota archaeon]
MRRLYLIALIIIIFLSSCKSINDCDRDYSVQNLREICYIDVAEANKDLRVCDLIEDPLTKDNCIAGVALARKDLSICNNIIDEDDKYRCYSLIALSKQNANMCNNIPKQSIKDGCFLGLSDCEQIKDQETKELCEKLK